MTLGRKRILLVGDSGVGKSHAVLDFLDEHLIERPETKIFVIDLDDSMTDLFDRYEDVVKVLENPEQGQHKMITSYTDLLSATVKAQQFLGKDDILVFEGLERGWELSQDEYTEEVFGKTSAQHLAELRKIRVEASQKDAPVSYDSARDWPSIRKMWKNDVLIPLTTATPWHIIATTAAKALVNLGGDTYNTNEFLRSIFSDSGVVPEGEKSDVKRFGIAITLGKHPQNGTYTFSVNKNRTGLGVTPKNCTWTKRPFWATLQMQLNQEEEEETDEKTSE